MPITFRHQFFEYWLNYFLFIFPFFDHCVHSIHLFMEGQVRLTAPHLAKFCFQGLKTHISRQVILVEFFLRRTFSQFQSLSIFFLISGHYFIFCPPLRALWSMFGVQAFQHSTVCNFFFTFSMLHGFVSLQSKVANKVSSILGFLYLSNHSKYNGVNSSVMHHLYIISIEHRQLSRQQTERRSP